MMKTLGLSLALLTLTGPSMLDASDWPQGSGSEGNFQTSEDGPVEWSVALDQHISWKLTLPETGQNTPVISNGKVFFSTLKPVQSDAETGKDIIAWCCDASSGDVLWKKEMAGRHPLRLSGCFSDSSAPPAATDGKHVIFTNASSGITCFTVDGIPVWNQDFLSVGRCLPFLSHGKFIFTRQNYPPEQDGNFPHKYLNSPKELWTQLQALDIQTGRILWTTECGINMGLSVMPQQLSDGREVVVAGRGGGHAPPERPEGISLVDLSNGATLWTLPLEKFSATMSFGIRNNRVHFFHGPNHLSVDAITGKIIKEVSITQNVSVCNWNGGRRAIEITDLKDAGSRNLTQTSNLLVGQWHYFRHYKQPWLGRINVDEDTVEYLELPLQVSRKPDRKDQLLWFNPDRKKIETQTIVPNDMKNSRGWVVSGDPRSKGSGWGHVAAPSPTAAGSRLYFPVMNGTIYVIDRDARTLDGNALIAINDLGPAGQSYTRASISFANGKAYAHTIKELICIGK